MPMHAGASQNPVNRESTTISQPESIPVSPDTLLAVVGTIAQAVWETDTGGKPLGDSPSWRACTGQSQQDWLHNGWIQAVHPDDRQNVFLQWQLAAEKAVPVNAELRLQNPANGWQWTNLRMAPCRDATGTVCKWVGINLEIPDRRQPECHSCNAEQLLEKVLNIETVGILFFDDEKFITKANDAFSHMSGIGMDALNSRKVNVKDLLIPASIASAENAQKELNETAGSTPVEKQYFRPDGSNWWGICAARKLNENENIEFILDTTLKKQAELTLRESEERLRTLMQNLPDYAIITHDPDGIVTSRNAGAQHIFGFTTEEAIGTSGAFIFTAEDRMNGEPEKERVAAVLEGRAFDDRYHIRKDGSQVYLSGVMSPLYDCAGRLLGFVKVVRDLTERRKMELALREADRRKDEFMAMLGHELRNPLAPVSNTLQVLKITHRHDPALFSSLDLISRHVDHMVHLVNDLLDMTRIIKGKVTVRPQRMDLVAAVAQAVEVSRSLFETAGRTLTADLPDYPVYINGDFTRIIQILNNLLNNGAKFTLPHGHVHVRVRRISDQVIIQVQDDGIGISGAHLEVVFETFVQIDAAMDRSQGGLGLGLSMVRQLVELHGGSVQVHSEGLGKGSTFTVQFPVLGQSGLYDE